MANDVPVLFGVVSQGGLAVPVPILEERSQAASAAAGTTALASATAALTTLLAFGALGAGEELWLDVDAQGAQQGFPFDVPVISGVDVVLGEQGIQGEREVVAFEKRVVVGFVAIDHLGDDVTVLELHLQRHAFEGTLALVLDLLVATSHRHRAAELLELTSHFRRPIVFMLEDLVDHHDRAGVDRRSSPAPPALDRLTISFHGALGLHRVGGFHFDAQGLAVSVVGRDRLAGAQGQADGCGVDQACHDSCLLLRGTVGGRGERYPVPGSARDTY